MLPSTKQTFSLDEIKGDILVYFGVKLTFNIEVVAGNTSHFHLPQVTRHSKLCGETTHFVIASKAPLLISCLLLKSVRNTHIR